MWSTGFEASSPASKMAAGSKAGQVVNWAVTYTASVHNKHTFTRQQAVKSHLYGTTKSILMDWYV